LKSPNKRRGKNRPETGNGRVPLILVKVANSMAVRDAGTSCN